MASTGAKYRQLASEEHQIDHQSGSQKWGIIWRGINVIMVVFFVLSAYVQINDPDPYIWIPVYTVPALLSLAIVFHPTVTDQPVWRTVCVVHMTLCVAGALYLSAVLVEILAGKIVNPLQHEEGRELGGTLIIIFWLYVCRFTTLGSTEPGHGATNALLLMTGILGCLPLVLWSLCFLGGLDKKLGHCKDMFSS